MICTSGMVGWLVLAASPLLAVALLLLALLGTTLLLVLLLLAIEHGRDLRRIEQHQVDSAARVDKRLRADRACVLRDVTHGAEIEKKDD